MRVPDMLRARAALLGDQTALLRRAEEAARELTLDEEAEYQMMERRIARFEDELRAEECIPNVTGNFSDDRAAWMRQGAAAHAASHDARPPQENPHNTGFELRAGETFAQHAHRDASAPDLGVILRGAVGLGGREARDAVSGLTGANGEVTIPSFVSAQIIDLAMEQSALVRAGATRVQMLARTHVIPRVSADPTLAWRAELGVVAENAEPSIEAATLTAKSVAGVAVISVEALEDASGLGTAIAASLARAVATAIDAAVLAEAQVTNGPLPLQLDPAINAGVQTWTPSMSDLPVIWGELAAQCGQDLSWVIAPYADVAVLMSETATSGGTWLGLPPMLGNVRLIGSAALAEDSTNILVGAGGGSIAIGSVDELRIIPLREHYMIKAAYTGGAGGNIGGGVGFMVYWRGDVAAVDPQRLMLFARG